MQKTVLFCFVLFSRAGQRVYPGLSRTLILYPKALKERKGVGGGGNSRHPRTECYVTGSSRGYWTEFFTSCRQSLPTQKKLDGDFLFAF